MTIKPLAELEDFEPVDSDQDCRGWTVVDAAGQQIGRVREMLADTEDERVTALVLDTGAQIPTGAVTFEDGRVVLAPAQMGERADRPQSGQVVVPVIEEAIRVGKRTVEGGDAAGRGSGRAA